MSDYGSTPPPPPSPAYGVGGVQGAPPPPNYLVWAILSTVFCCLPLGIASIVFSTQVNDKWAMGDTAGAQEASEKAKSFAMWATIAGVIVTVIFVVVFTILILAGAFTFATVFNTVNNPVPTGGP